MNNWKSNLKRHIEKFHKGEKIVSNKHYKMIYHDEMKDEENCQNIEKILTTDENVSYHEMQMDTDEIAAITGKSLTEALTFAEHGENMLCT